MNSPIASIRKVQEELERLSLEKSFSQAQRVIFSVIGLLDPAISDKDPETYFQLFTDSDGKIRANAGWFFEDLIIADRKAVYKVHAENSLDIDFKAYGVNKASKRIVSWTTGVTPNFEDEAFNGRYGVGIDFIVPKSCDRVIVVLTNNYVVRTLELKGKLTATYQEILAKWVAIKDFSNKKEFHSILWESFDLQPLNKKFYAGISERFILLRQHLEKESIFDQKHAAYFANRLMGRVIFCWFLDHKGVLNGEKKYFDAKAYPSSTDYYRGRLETLFYRVLNTPIADRELMVQDDVTPFLNGGLFEPRATDLFENPKLTFPKNYFDDLFEFLSGYNFTTDESTSQFQQVAIDPEMLGRIFENLLAEMTEETGEQARKAKGAFYTPREIVDYMCRESLREYLKTKLPEDEFRDKRLEQLIDRPDKEFQDQDHNWRRDWKPYKEAIIKALDELTVLDPACGSGAFPIGMLQLLVQVYERLESRFDSYRTKLQIIEKNLYGVDIEPMAVEIARLRAWLSIIVDEEADSRKIKPLPNLEFKFICANSLIDLDQNGDTPLGGRDHNALAEELRALRDGYFNTESLKKKKSLREKYEKLINEQEGLFGESTRSKQLKTYRPFDNEWSAGFFNPKFMFGVEKFDVVIGNPPYLRIQGIDKIASEEYKKNYHSATGKYDLYVIFSEKAIKLLNENGIVNFIMPHKWINASFGKGLREYSKGRLYKFISFGAYQVFTASTYTSLAWFKAASNSVKFLELNRNLKSNDELKQFLDSIRDDDYSEIESRTLDSEAWSFGDKKTFSVLQKLSQQPYRVKDVFEGIYQGIVSGDNDAFYLQNCRIEGEYLLGFSDLLNAELRVEKNITKPLLQGNNVARYRIFFDNTYIIYPYEVRNSKTALIDEDLLKSKFPLCYGYLISIRKRLECRGSVTMKYPHWYSLWNFRKIENQSRRKIVTPDICSGASMSFDSSGMFFYNDTCYGLVKKESDQLSYELYLALFNSSLCWFFLRNTGSVLRGGYFRFKTKYLEMFPLPEVSKFVEEVKRLEILAVEIMDVKKKDHKADTKKMEIEVNQLVYQLYDLTEEEIKIVEENLDK